MKYVLGIRKRETESYLYNTYGILTLQQIHMYCCTLFMYKYYYKDIPIMFENFFVSNDAIHNYLTRQRSQLHPPRFSSNLSKTFLRYQGVILWNNILRSNIVDENAKPSSFKKSLKNYIFKLQFD